MDKFDWHKESPGWKLAAWALYQAPRIIASVGGALAAAYALLHWLGR